MSRLVKALVTLTSYLITSGSLADSNSINFGSLASYSKEGHLQMIVEIPAGTTKKREYNYATDSFPVDEKNGVERSINFLPYIGNYGFIPSTMMNRARGGDGDALDVLVLSEHAKTGTKIEIIPIALLNLIDDGEIDSKIIAIPADVSRRIIRATSYREFDLEYSNAKYLVEVWFSSYKGPGIVEFISWENEDYARVAIEKWQVPQ